MALKHRAGLSRQILDILPEATRVARHGSQAHSRFRSRLVAVLLTDLSAPVAAALESFGILPKVGREYCFERFELAAKRAHELVSARNGHGSAAPPVVAPSPP